MKQLAISSSSLCYNQIMVTQLMQATIGAGPNVDVNMTTKFARHNTTVTVGVGTQSVLKITKKQQQLLMKKARTLN
jgi:hypothetical protein